MCCELELYGACVAMHDVHVLPSLPQHFALILDGSLAPPARDAIRRSLQVRLLKKASSSLTLRGRSDPHAASASTRPGGCTSRLLLLSSGSPGPLSQAGSHYGAASSCQCGGSLRSGPVRVTRLHLGVPAARRPGSAQDPTGAAGDSALLVARAHSA